MPGIDHHQRPAVVAAHPRQRRRRAPAAARASTPCIAVARPIGRRSNGGRSAAARPRRRAAKRGVVDRCAAPASARGRRRRSRRRRRPPGARDRTRIRVPSPCRTWRDRARPARRSTACRPASRRATSTAICCGAAQHEARRIGDRLVEAHDDARRRRPRRCCDRVAAQAGALAQPAGDQGERRTTRATYAAPAAAPVQRKAMTSVPCGRRRLSACA